MAEIGSLMRTAPVIPVLVIESAADAQKIAEAFVRGGLPVLEVTLRTPAALDVIREMKKVEGAIVGAGTVLNEKDLDAAMAAGAEFIVSPGLTEKLAFAAADRKIAFLPGIATASDLMRGFDLGLSHFKFFPAEANGGIAALKALSAPFANAKFCPTGGVTLTNASDYLALESVLCVGGSWLLPKGETDFAKVESRAKEAASLR
jgi:2-dehydro-3-deoxyphosphogluconate aldolase/(4S)-4-hydroxy-2-oxoglutarate aldolase